MQGDSSALFSGMIQESTNAAFTKRPRKDDDQVSEEPLAQYRLVEIEGTSRERDDVQADLGGQREVVWAENSRCVLMF